MTVCQECLHPTEEHSNGVVCEDDDMYYFPCEVSKCFCCTDGIVSIEIEDEFIYAGAD